ncbi:MAG: aspartate kinase [Phycisphaerales bacterium]
MTTGERVIVQKFGGSSVADAAKMRACGQRVLDERRAGHAVVVVVSAMGDTTDDLLTLADTVGGVGNADGVAMHDRREVDQLLATGEQVSIAMMTLVLQSLGLPAVSLTGSQAGIVTDSAFGRASILSIDAARLSAELEAGRVPVVAGFQGVTERGETTTLGRGGSDTTAVALAAALAQHGRSGGRSWAGSCDIYKDVDGVFTADPRIVPEARRRPTVTYDEMLEAAALGAQVIHPRAVELAKKFAVPLRVLHSHKPSTGTGAVGTSVIADETAMESRVVSSVVLKRNVGRVSIRGIANHPGVQAKVFGPIAAAAVSVDDIIQEDDGPGTINLTFTVDRKDLAELTPIVHRIAGGLHDPSAPPSAASGPSAEAVRFDVGLSTVSVVGAGMRTSAGVAALLFDALAAERIRVENITTSEIRISCVVAENDGERALRAAHYAFGLGSDEQEKDKSARVTVRTGSATRV